MKPNIYLLIILFLTNQHAGACLWQDGEKPFWPSNNIEVCFLPQEKELTNDPALLKAYKDARRMIEQLLNQQITRRNTGFKLSGYKTCDYDHRIEGPKNDLPSMIRINLGSDILQDRVETTNGLIGPASGTMSVNVHIGYISQTTDKDTNATVWRNNVTLDGVGYSALHEVMHMFGIHHEGGLPKLEKDAHGNYVKLGDTLDENSIMCLGGDHCKQKPMGTAPALSETDIRCLLHISDRTIQDYAPIEQGVIQLKEARQ